MFETKTIESVAKAFIRNKFMVFFVSGTQCEKDIKQLKMLYLLGFGGMVKVGSLLRGTFSILRLAQLSPQP
ncbi:MAG: hypothetical protein DMG07_29150 [Acidobacteria bacterium]|nr:MAG: hypothetical protein DMG07_29150 [Acidobacteriota bacterium]